MPIGRPCVAEAHRHAHRRQAGQRGVDHHLHPAVVGVHRAAGDLARPGPFGREGPDLRGGQHQQVEALEQADHVAVEARAVGAGRIDLRAAQALALVVFPLRLGLELRVLLRVGAQRAQRAGHQEAPPGQPGLPDLVAGVAQAQSARPPRPAPRSASAPPRTAAGCRARRAGGRPGRTASRCAGRARPAAAAARRRCRPARWTAAGARRSRPAPTAASPRRAPCGPSGLRCRAAPHSRRRHAGCRARGPGSGAGRRRCSTRPGCAASPSCRCRRPPAAAAAPATPPRRRWSRRRCASCPRGCSVVPNTGL